MTDQNQNVLTIFLDKTALDWIPIIFNEKFFPEYPQPTAERQQEIRNHAAHLSGESLDIAVKHFEKLLDEDDKRRGTVESKAFSLFGITGIASSFIVGFAQFLLANNSFPESIRVAVMILYALTAISLLITLILARKATIVGKYKFMSPTPSDLLYLTKRNREYIFQQYVADLLLSYENNLALGNDKATYVRGAQDWFRNSMVLLFVLSLLFTIYLIFKPNWDLPISPKPIPVIVVTATPSPTNTATSTPTATNTPTPLPTSTPSATPTPTTP